MKLITRICVRSVGRNPDNPNLRSTKEHFVPVEQTLEINGDGDTANTLASVQKNNWIMEIYECSK